MSDNKFPKEIEFALKPDQFDLLMDALNDAISGQARYGNHAAASRYGRLQEVIKLQKVGQDYMLIQAREALKIK